MTAEKKILLTIDEALDRVKTAVEKSGWTGAAATIDFWFKEPCREREEKNSRYYYFQGIIDSLAWSGIISFEERSQIIDSLIENEF